MNSFFRNAWDPVFQDYMVRLQDLSEFVNYAHQEIKCYPLWLCPVICNPDMSLNEQRPLAAELSTKIIVDVGIYGYANRTSNTIWV